MRLLSERGGAPITQVANDNVPEHASRPVFLPALALTTDQRANSDFQKPQVGICYLNTYQVVQFKSFSFRSKITRLKRSLPRCPHHSIVDNSQDAETTSPSTDEQIKKMGYTYTMEYYSA